MKCGIGFILVLQFLFGLSQQEKSFHVLRVVLGGIRKPPGRSAKASVSPRMHVEAPHFDVPLGFQWIVRIDPRLNAFVLFWWFRLVGRLLTFGYCRFTLILSRLRTGGSLRGGASCEKYA